MRRMALGRDRALGARLAVCAVRERIAVWQWLALLGLAGAANAAGSNMPWEAPLESLLESIQGPVARIIAVILIIVTGLRSEEHTSELQSLMRISYAVFCLKKKKTQY